MSHPAPWQSLHSKVYYHIGNQYNFYETICLIDANDQVICELIGDTKEEAAHFLRARVATTKSLPLCPDHRDKVKGKNCNRAKDDDCYQFKKWLDNIIDKLDPDMGRAEIVELREQLIRERAKYGSG